jgi:hypothetical protein
MPMHLALLKRLMEAVKQTNLNIRVVNAAYPDATNAVLSKVGLGPEVGIGNVGIVIPAIRQAVAMIMQQPLERVDIRLVGQHYFSFRIAKAGSGEGLPYAMSVLLDGLDVTREVDLEKVFALLPIHFKRPRGVNVQHNTAASAVSVLKEMSNCTGKVIHAPGPNGLIGGYPIRIDEKGKPSCCLKV